MVIPKENRVELEEILLKADSWGALQGTLVFDPALGAAPVGEACFTKFPLIRLINLLASVPVQKETEGWPLSGTLFWERGKKDGPLDFRITLEGSGLNGAAEGGRSWAVKGLDSRVTARIEWDPLGREISGFWKQEFLKGSLAYEDWFFSFNAPPLLLELNGKMSYPPGGFRVMGSLKFQHPALGPGRVPEIWIGVREPSITRGGSWEQVYRFRKAPRCWQNRLREIFFPGSGGSNPGGYFAEFSLDGSNRDYRIQGRVRGSDLEFDLRDPGIHFHISQLDLPVHWGSTLSREPVS